MENRSFIRKYFSNLKLQNLKSKSIFLVSGIAATLWFLSRVIPKPSRAYYPCVQAAAPVMAGFVVYLLSITGSMVVLKRIGVLLNNRKYLLALTMTIVFLFLVGISFFVYSPSLEAKEYASQDDFAPNQPMGIGQGVNPGRVVWVWDKQVTNENCEQVTNRNGVLDDGDDLWFMDKNTEQDFTDYMFSKSIQKLTGKGTDQEAWDAMFRYFNLKKGVGDKSYQDGEIIFIKTNHGSAWGTDRFDSGFGFNDKAWNAGYTETGPQLVLSVLRHLVNRVGVPQNYIYVGDPMKNIYKEYYLKWHSEFPDVKYLGNDLIASNIPNLSTHGRTSVKRTSKDVLFFSDKSEINNVEHMQKLYTIFEEADYMINLTALKPHDVAGITLTAKNHFGSHASKTAAHLHNVLVNQRHSYGLYRVLVDLMGHRLLGENTLLSVVDGMWSSENTELSLPKKWTMYPFNNDWPSSIFVSQDQVALESVCFDFLRTEYTVGNYSKNNPNMAATDDYLHQAADEANWPAGLVYNPDGTGKIGSLGVHEHWNNATDMQYSANLGTGNGIELVKVWVGNHIPLATAPIPDISITQTGIGIIVIEDVREFFYDADGDLLTFSAESSDARLTSMISNNQLVLNLNTLFEHAENAKVVVTANDGKDSNSLSFRVDSDFSASLENQRSGLRTVEIYPNPAKEFVSIRMDKTGDYVVYIMNNLGQFIDKVGFHDNHKYLNLSGLDKGIYHIQVSENSQITHKGTFVKE
jgi:hypothetical protein